MGGADFDRAAMLARLEAEEFDLLVVGGGVTGAGVALDAAARGLRTALVERDDFAAGTSSKSSKLVHGGLRYLKDDPRLVREALRERERLRRNAPHLVGIMPFMIPVLTKDGVVSRTVARALGSAMWMYDIGGGWRIGKLHRRLRKKATLAHFPTMPPARVAAGYVYYDAAADDARLVLTLARTAASRGAAVANRCHVVGLHHADGRVAGATVRADGREFTVRSRVVVNATGVWADGLREMDEGTDPDTIRPAKGVHLTVPWEKVRNDIAVVVPVPKDKRSLFLVPWGPLPDGTFRHAYIGTTDTDYDGPLEDPQCTAEDVEYVLRAVNASISEPITAADVTGVWAGLRPLVKGGGSGRTADLSRRHLVQTSDHGVVTVTGGKLTTYREMAADAVDAALGMLGRSAKCTTARLRLLGADGYKAAAAGTTEGHLGNRYGTLAAEVQALVAADPSLGEPLVAGLPYLRAEAVYAVRHEMATTLDDVLTRRTRARLQDRAATVAAAPAVAALIAPELGWDDTELAIEVTTFVVACIAEEVRP